MYTGIIENDNRYLSHRDIANTLNYHQGEN